MAKKLKSWRDKSFYKIIAPKNFDSKEIGDTMADNPKKLMGRSVEVSLADLTGDLSKQHLTLIFEIVDVKGDRAYTKFKKFVVNPGYIRAKIRKGSSKIDYVGNIDLDKSKVQVRVVTITHQNIKTSRKHEIIRIITETLRKYKGMKLDDFIQLTLFGRVGTEIYKNVKKIAAIRRVEVEHVRIL
ncbi:MAG: 30S ribosomal protein S3ae [Candidatus Altiarchaeales archaeon]|nr:MAG: 30S ribosomal protein S3ae [Candidatus Altiarchaeales archaeon]RLI94551.1 MAG: 30S ribosomal protein S3ae [Candidatus Altiarchaeales archaeon]HDO82181.1 30S ribosomal protein S3ae [Candidatus Altiarchaeales archaeon]HEX54830.1 30S ribosomal protein S3ae [Candidatus Altiarchaeales archaeon]